MERTRPAYPRSKEDLKEILGARNYLHVGERLWWTISYYKSFRRLRKDWKRHMAIKDAVCGMEYPMRVVISGEKGHDFIVAWNTEINLTWRDYLAKRI